MQHSVDTARTMTFAVMILSQLTMIFSIRTGNDWFTSRFFTNRWLWLTIFLVLGLTLWVMLTPSMQSLFHLSPLSGEQWILVVALTFGVLVMSEIFKFFVRLFVK